MKLPLIFWIIAAPLWCVSGLLALFFLLSILAVRPTAFNNQQGRAALLRRAQFVEGYLKSNGRLPSNGELATASTGILDYSNTNYELYTSRPEDYRFNFPAWPDGKVNFAVGYWNGDESNFYDSNSHTTTQDESSKTSFHLKNALWPLGLSLGFGLPPLLLLWFLRKRLSLVTKPTDLYPD